MRIKYILSGLVGIIVLFGGLAGAAGTREKPRRKAGQALEETLFLLGKGPVVAQEGPVYFVPLAAFAQAGNGGTSDASRSLIDEVRADNPYYQKSEELLATAAALYDAEAYDESRAVSLEAQRYARLADQEAEQQARRREIEGLIADAARHLKAAEDAVLQVKKISPATPAPAQFKAAQTAFADARFAKETNDWDAVPVAAALAKAQADEAVAAADQLLKTVRRSVPDPWSEGTSQWDSGSSSNWSGSSDSSYSTEWSSSDWSSAGTAPAVTLPPERQASAPSVAAASSQPSSQPSRSQAAGSQTASQQSNVQAAGSQAASQQSNVQAAGTQGASQPRSSQPAGTASAAQPSRPAGSSAGSAARTPAPPALTVQSIGASPRVPDLSGSTSQERAVVSAPPSGSASQRVASSASTTVAAAPRSSGIVDNTPPVPSLAPLNTGAALAAAPAVSTPTAPGLPGAAGTARSAPAQTAAAPTRTAEPPLRNSAIPNPAAATSAPHITSSLGQEEETPIPQNTGVRLAAQYQVQSWAASSDCLWNIAGKPWVYGDPSKWTALYRANVRKLPDSQNPNLLPPNVVLDIPSLNNEPRQGVSTWEGIPATTP